MKKYYFATISASLALFIIISSISLSDSTQKNIRKVADFIGEQGNAFLLFQNLANPYVRFVKIPEGLRKEEVALIYERELGWSAEDVTEFTQDIENTSAAENSNLEGYYFPSTYVVPVGSTGEDVRNEMVEKFNTKVPEALVGKKMNPETSIINMDTALKIASLIQREAAGKQDMNLISGIIWNRVWMGMSLDIDATLQYAKGNEDKWWPQVLSADKKIDSPYNTYKNKGLPPSPIANPGLAAIAAAYNPQKTSCIFYFHDKNRMIHCSKTYAEHKALVEQYLR